MKEAIQNKPKNFADFIKEQRKQKHKQAYLDKQKLILLYDSPKEFFLSFKSILNEIKVKKCICDNEEKTFMMHYLSAMETNQNVKEFWTNLVPTFKEIKQYLSFKTRGGQTFLHLLAKRKHPYFFLQIFCLLAENDILSEELLSIEDVNQMLFCSNILLELRENYVDILKKEDIYQKFKNFFLILKKYFPNFYQEKISLEDKYEIEKLILKNTFGTGKIYINLDEIKTIFERTPILIHDIISIENLNFNMLNWLIERNSIDKAQTLLSFFENSKNENLKEQSPDWIYEHLLFVLSKVAFNSKIMEYLTYLCKIALKSSKNDPAKIVEKKSKQNIFHAMFKRENFSTKEMIIIFDFIKTNLCLKQNTVEKLLNKKDGFLRYPVIYFLLNAQIRDKEDEEFTLKLLDLTKMKAGKKINPNEYLVEFRKISMFTQFKFLLEYLEKNKIIDIFYEKYSKNSGFLLNSFSSSKNLPKETFNVILKYIFTTGQLNLKDSKKFECLINFFICKVDLFSDEDILSLITHLTNIQSKEVLQAEKVFLSNTNLKDNIFEIPKNAISKIHKEIEQVKIESMKSYYSLKKLYKVIIKNASHFHKDTLAEIWKKMVDYLGFSCVFEFVKITCLSKNQIMLEVIKDNCQIIYDKFGLFEAKKDKKKTNWLFYFCLIELQKILIENSNNQYIMIFYLNFIAGIEQNEAQIKYFEMIIFFSYIKNSKNKEALQIFNGLIEGGVRKIYKISTTSKIYLLSYLLEETLYSKVFESLLLPLSSKDFAYFYESLKQIQNQKRKSKPTLRKVIEAPKCEWEGENLIVSIYNLIFEYIETKYVKYSKYYIKIVQSACNLNKDSKILEEQALQFLQKFIEVLQVFKIKKVLSEDDKKYFLRNFYLNFDPIFFTKKPSSLTKSEKCIKEIILFIKDNYKNDNFFSFLVKNPYIRNYLYSNYQKENDDTLMGLLLKIGFQKNDENKQNLITFFEPKYILDNKLSKFICSSTRDNLIVNPFSFLAVAEDFTNEKVLQYKSFFESILNNESIKAFEKMKESKYFPTSQILKISTPSMKKNFGMFINNTLKWIKEVPEFNTVLSKNQTINEAFCHLLLSFFNGKDQLPQKKEINSFVIELITHLNSLFRNFHNQYNEKLYSWFIEFLDDTKNIKNSILNSLSDKNSQMTKIFLDTFLNSITSLSALSLGNYRKNITKIFLSLLSLNNTFLFEKVLRMLLDLEDKKKFKLLITEENKQNFFKPICFSYSIFLDELELFKKLISFFDFPKEKDSEKVKKLIIVSQLDLQETFAMKYINSLSNPFTKFLANNKQSCLLYYCCVLPSLNIFNYLMDNLISQETLTQIYKDDCLPHKKISLLKLVISTQNVDFIRKVNEIVHFNSFSLSDYTLISKKFKTKDLYEKIIKTTILKFENFDKMKLFLTSLNNNNNDLSDCIFAELSQEDKERMLTDNSILDDSQFKQENILHILVIYSKTEILKDFLELIKQNDKLRYKLFEFCQDEVQSYTDIKNIQLETQEEQQSVIKTDYSPQDFIENYNNKDFPGWKVLRSPLSFAILRYNFKAVALLYNFYPSFYYQLCYENHNAEHEVRISFFLDVAKKAKKEMTNLNPEFEEILETVLTIYDLIPKDIRNECYILLFHFLLMKQNYLETTSQLMSIFKLVDKKSTFPILYILVNILSLYPKEDAFMLFERFLTGKELKDIPFSEDNLLYLLYLMEMNDKTIIPVSKYLPIKFGSEYELISFITNPDINKFAEKNLKRKESYEINKVVSEKLSQNPMTAMINCGLLGFKELGFILAKEFNLVKNLKNLTEEGKVAVMEIFLSQEFLLTYQLENFDKVIKTFGKSTPLQIEPKKEEEGDKRPEEENLLNQKKVSKDLSEKYFVKDKTKWNGYITEDYFDRNLISIFNNESQFISSDFINRVDYLINFSDSLLYYLNNNEEIINFKDNIKLEIQKEVTKRKEKEGKDTKNRLTKRLIFDSILEILNTTATSIQKIINLQKKDFYTIYFSKNPFKSVFQEITKKLNLNILFSCLIEKYCSVFSHRKILPKFLDNYSELYFNSERFNNIISRFDNYGHEYLKYFNKLNIYIQETMNFIYKIYFTPLESIVSEHLTKKQLGKSLFIKNKSQLILDLYNNLSVTFNQVKESSSELKTNDSINNLMNLMYNLLIGNTNCPCEIKINYYYDDKMLQFSETSTNLSINQFITQFFEFVFNLWKNILSDQNSNGLIFSAFPEILLGIQTENTQVEKLKNDLALFEKNIVQKVLSNQILYINYIYCMLRAKKFDFHQLLIDKNENYFTFFLKEIGLNSEDFNYILQNLSLYKGLEKIFTNLDNYHFISFKQYLEKQKTIDFSTLNLNIIEILYPDIFSFFKLISEFFCVLECLKRISNIFNERANVIFDLMTISNLINNYIEQEWIFNMNKSFIQAQTTKKRISSLFKQKVYEHYFNQSNSVIQTIMNTIIDIDQTFNPLTTDGSFKDNDSKRKMIKYVVNFEKDYLISGKIETFSNNSDINKLFEINQISYQVKKEINKEIQEIMMVVQLSCNFLKVNGDEEEFFKILLRNNKGNVPFIEESSLANYGIIEIKRQLSQKFLGN